ncbi:MULTISPECIES: hypothetical protein [unclassified Imperialibacter]|uniref:hypothetical protein n=1 Tax=unclassified Imperialibacter TaxID=2629706 RepID=UPI00191B35CD|nr:MULTISPECIES: hypothetical protein [unclassified Imperialibacter]
MKVSDYITAFENHFEKYSHLSPWQITSRLTEVLTELLESCDSDFSIHEGIALHKTVTIEKGPSSKHRPLLGRNALLGHMPTCVEASSSGKE